MDNSDYKIRRYVVSIVLLAVLIIASFYIFNALTFRVSGTNPKLNDVATASPFLKINFNKQLSSQGLILSSNPSSAISSYKVSGKTLDINLNIPLDSSKKYTITVISIYSKDNKRIMNKVFVFYPKYVASAQIPKDQGSVLLNNQSNYSQVTGGVLQLLPYLGPKSEYKITNAISYQGGITKVTITITAPTRSAQQAGYKWLNSFGYDLSKYNIKYVTAKVR